FGPERRDQFQFAIADPIPARGNLGLARRLATAVGADAQRVDGRGFGVQPASARADGGARDRSNGARERGIHFVHVADLYSFDRLVSAGPDGRDLNPLLQDPGMVIHPPMLYMGYVGFSVAFAFAIAALLGGRLDATWA